MALDVLPVQASSVPCEQLFSGSKQTATDRRARLGADCLEELQLMKFAWWGKAVDIAAWTSDQIEGIDLTVEYQDLHREQEEGLKWDKEYEEVLDSD